jgi:predicted transcriptional regulator
MAKTLTIQIRSVDTALEQFRKAFRGVAAGRQVDKREAVYFASIEAARNLLTRNRLALLRAVRSARSGSIYELSKMVNRDLKNVQDDLKILERYGFTGPYLHSPHGIPSEKLLQLVIGPSA